jgi:hypothetical protein
MSTKENTLYLEDMQVRFDELKDGFPRMTIIRELRENNFKDEADSLIENWHQERQAYLDEIGIEESSVLYDEEDPIREFYFIEEDNGSPNEEGYWSGFVKKELPMYLNVNYWTK